MKRTLIFLFLFTLVNFAQPVCTKNDSLIFLSKSELAKSRELNKKNLNEIITEIGKSFIGTDYLANSLQNDGVEKLVINLAGLDCYTFLESTLALSRIIKNQKVGFSEFVKEIENIRYRDGKLVDYPSRLHYFSDWIFDLQKRNIVKDITKSIGGEAYSKTIDFMSKHSDSYKELKLNKNYISVMNEIEKKISSRKYYYIPQNRIQELEKNIQSGDLIGLTTSIDGLDITHVGIAVKLNNRLHFLHAPITGKKIQITDQPLCDYVKKNKKQTGIMVIRPVDN